MTNIKELKPLSDEQMKLLMKLINEMPEATVSEVGLLDASDVFEMLFKCNNPKFIDAYNAADNSSCEEQCEKN